MNNIASTLEEKVAALEAKIVLLEAERDEYKKLYLSFAALAKRLEAGILGQKRERYTKQDNLTMSLLAGLLENSDAASVSPEVIEETQEVRAHTKAKPTGRKPLPENLPRVDIEILPPEVEQQGLQNFTKIGEDVTETVERRHASLVVVRVHKPKFVLKEKSEAGETQVQQAAPIELPIPKGLAGPSFLADTVVKRFGDYLPLHRLERVYGREGLQLSRSTMCEWHMQLSMFIRPLIESMKKDALNSPYLCMDATGVLVQGLEKCRNAHFWVLVAPERHVLFYYTPKHNSAAVDSIVQNYKGYLVTDAHSVYQHLYKNGDIVGVGCNAHARRYFFKALESDKQRAEFALEIFKKLFQIERDAKTLSPEKRKQVRLENSKPLIEKLFEWCEIQANAVVESSPIQKAIQYAQNQKAELCRFLEDGRLPIHNNFSERELRREALGRKNWMFLGSDDGGETNANFVTLIASCQLHGIEPYAYLRDVLCLFPNWNQTKVLELAPVNWNETLQRAEVQAQLQANVFRQVALGILKPTDEK